MPSGRRLGVLLAVLLAAIGLAVWQSFSPGGLLWRPPRPPLCPVYDESSHLIPPPQRPPATPAPHPVAPERGRCSVERLLTLSERYAPHQLEGNVGEIYVDRCDGSGPARVVMSGSSGWGNLRALDD